MRERSVLRLHLAEKWEPQDYITAISAIENLYYVTLFWDQFSRDEVDLSFRKGPRYYPRAGFPRPEEAVARTRDLADQSERLIVNQIRHASPGFIDFEGFGAAIDVLDRVLARVIELVTHRRIRRELNKQAEIATEMQRENLNTLKIENARRLLELERDFPSPRRPQSLELVLVEEQSKIEGLAARGLITDQRDHDG